MDYEALAAPKDETQKIVTEKLILLFSKAAHPFPLSVHFCFSESICEPYNPYFISREYYLKAPLWTASVRFQLPFTSLVCLPWSFLNYLEKTGTWLDWESSSFWSLHCFLYYRFAYSSLPPRGQCTLLYSSACWLSHPHPLFLDTCWILDWFWSMRSEKTESKERAPAPPLAWLKESSSSRSQSLVFPKDGNLYHSMIDSQEEGKREECERRKKGER